MVYVINKMIKTHINLNIIHFKCMIVELLTVGIFIVKLNKDV